MALRILRKVTRDVIKELHDPITPTSPKTATGADFLYHDKNAAWFEQSYVDSEFPRASEVNATIMAGTTGFAVWDDEQGVVATFKDYKSAAYARDNAKMTLAVNFEIPEADEEPAPAPAARKGKNVDAAELGAAAS